MAKIVIDAKYKQRIERFALVAGISQPLITLPQITARKSECSRCFAYHMGGVSDIWGDVSGVWRGLQFAPDLDRAKYLGYNAGYNRDGYFAVLLIHASFSERTVKKDMKYVTY